MPLPYSEISSYEYESHFSRHKLPANLETSLHSPAQYLMLCHADLLKHMAMVCRALLRMGTERSSVLHCLCSDTSYQSRYLVPTTCLTLAWIRRVKALPNRGKNAISDTQMPPWKTCILPHLTCSCSQQVCCQRVLELQTALLNPFK